MAAMAAMAAMACCEGAHDLGMALSNLQAMCGEGENPMKMARFPHPFSGVRIKDALFAVSLFARACRT